MNKIFYTLYFFVITLNLFSQFNVIVEDSLKNHIYSCEIKEDNGYYYIINGSGILSRGICITKTDSTASIIYNKLYEKNNEEWYELNNTILHQGNTMLPFIKIIDGKRSSSLMVFDNNYDTLFTKDLKIDTVNVSLYNILKLNNNYFLTGQKKNQMF